MAKTKKRGATRTIWGSPLSHFLPKKARGHEARSTSTSRKTVHSTNTMPPLKVGDSVRERAKPGRIGVVKRATKGDNNKKHKWDVEFEDGSTEMKSSQALLKITKLTGKQMADKIAEIVGKPVVTERKSTNGTKNLESEEAEAVKKKKPSRMTTTLEAETDEDFTVIPTLDGGVMEVQDINNLESDEEYRLKEMYYKVKKAQLIKEKWSVTVKADRLKMGVGSTVRFRKESDSRIGTIIAKADDNVKWIVKFDDDDFPETLAYQSLQLVDDLAEETGEYVWRILDESVPTKDDPKPAEYKDVGVTDFHFGMMADDETSKENSDYQLPYLKLLIHLWPGDWWKQLQQMNEYIQSQNEEHGRHKGYKKCKSVTAKEWWKFIGILIVAAAEGKGGHALFERAEGRKARTATETTNYGKDGRNIMSKNRFDAIRKYFPYAFQDLEAMRNGDPWHMVSKLVEDFNTNRAEKIAASVYKVVDELISAWRPQSTPKGGLPHLSFIMRKPEPLGTEFKSLVCSITGIMLALEIQRGRDPMMKLDYSEEHGACAGCTLRLMELAQYSGQSNEDTSDKGKKECYYGDSWFSSVRTALQFAERGHAYVGAVKTATKFFPNLELEAEMEHFPSGSHIVMECDVPGKDVKLLAIGYRYNCKKTLLFVATKDAGDTLPGEPYIAKYNDSVGNVCQREVARPAILSNYFKKSNKVDSHNHVRQGIIALEKMWVTHDCWFRLVTTLIGITATDAWKASRHQSPGEDLSAIQFCDRLAYDCFENDFPNSDMCLFISGRNGSTNIDDMISPRQNPATPAVVTPTSIGAIFESHKFTKNHDDIEPYVDNRAPDSERCRRRVCRADGCKRPTSWVCGAHECFNFEYNANGKRCKGLYYCQEHWHVHWSQVGERFF